MLCYYFKEFTSCALVVAVLSTIPGRALKQMLEKHFQIRPISKTIEVV